MIVELLIGQLFLVLFNIGNVFIDAYRILDNKKIAHGVNGTAYVLFIIIICFLLHIPIIPALLFGIIGFFNRQLSFDIPLNLRRELEWYYQSAANPPKSIIDRIERFIFGNGQNVGKLIAKTYLSCYAALLITFIVLYG